MSQQPILQPAIPVPHQTVIGQTTTQSAVPVPRAALTPMNPDGATPLSGVPYAGGVPYATTPLANQTGAAHTAHATPFTHTPATTGTHATGTHAVGTHATGTHATGTHATGTHATGTHPTGTHTTGTHTTGTHTGATGTHTGATGTHGTSGDSGATVRRVETADEIHHQPTNLVNMAQNLKGGELPSNAEIQTELGETREFLRAKEATSRTPQEAQMMRDMHQLVQGVQVTLESKNPNNLFQRFLADLSLLLERKTANTSANGQLDPSVVNEAVQSMTALRTIIPALAKDQSFRRGLVDFFNVGKDLFIDTKHQNITSMQDIPESRKREALAHLSKIFSSFGGHPESKQAFSGVFTIWNAFNDQLYTQLDSYYKVDPQVLTVQTEAQQLVEAYTGGRSITLWLSYLRLVASKIKNDQELSIYLREVREFLQRALDNPQLLNSEEGYQRADVLINRGNAFHWKYRNDTDFNNLWTESTILLTNIQNDPHVNMLQAQIAQVANTMTYQDAEGKVAVNTDLLGTLRSELLPFFLSRIREIPIKGFEVTDSEQFEYLRFDDISLIIEDILPDNIHVRTENNTDITMDDLRKPLTSQSYMHLRLDGVRPKIKDFYFAYKRRKGMLKEDEGRADLTITGAGLTVDIKFALEMDNGHAHLGKHKVDLVIDNMDINILEAKNHPHLLKMGSSMFKGRIQKQAEEAIRNQLDERGYDIANLLNNKVLNNLSLTKGKEFLTKQAVQPGTATGTTPLAGKLE